MGPSLLAALLALGTVALPASAADEPTIEARVMLAGHARIGSWMGISVRVRNEGPPIVGELRMAGGAQGWTQYSHPVDLPTGSDKTFQLFAQPPAFGGQVELALVGSDGRVWKRTVDFRVHEGSRLVVGVIAEQPRGIFRGLDLEAGTTHAPPALVELAPEDLPERVEAWAPLDRLVWQDVDSTRLTTGQLAALRAWIAGGGRLVVVGGTTGFASLSAFPDDLLPYRPLATLDVAPSVLAGLLGELPKDATEVPAMSGELSRGRALATSGDRAIAAEAPYGSGSVTLIGFDPTVGWLADSDADEALWRRLIPGRTSSPAVVTDDQHLVTALSQLPALALPPIGGLLALLLGYIALVGPINYLVLRRLDRREWAWITMPVLIAVFATGSYGFGIALRGLDVVINEVAIVRGAPDATEGTAQVYVGVFSPGRGTYQVEVPSGALLSSTIAGEVMGMAGTLDIVQDTPSRVRNLSFVQTTSLRSLRAETPAAVPRVQAELRLEGGVLRGVVRNLSDQALEKPAIVLGGSVAVLQDLPPGAEQDVSLRVEPTFHGQSLADRILGQAFFGDQTRSDTRTQRNMVRHYVIDQLTFQPNFGFTGQLPAEAPVLLAWGTRDVLDMRIDGQVPRRTGNVLYYVPLPMRISGTTVFDGELVRSSVVEVDANFFTREPWSMGLGRGTATIAYRPISFEGRLTPARLLLGLNFGGGPVPGGPVKPVQPKPIPVEEPAEPPEPACDPTIEDCGKVWEGLPELELFDLEAGTWARLPTLAMGASYEVVDPARYVDPTSGAVLVRLVNDHQDSIHFSLQVRIEGIVA